MKIPIIQFENNFAKALEIIDSPADWTDPKKAEAVRSIFFELEGLARIYTDILDMARDHEKDIRKKDVETMERLRNVFKFQLENKIGKSFEESEIVGKIGKLETKNSELKILFDQTKKRLEKESDKSLEEMMKSLEDRGWADKMRKRFSEISEELEKIAWPKKNKILKYFRQSLIEDIQHLKKSLPKDPNKPQGDELHPLILEKGTHKIRRSFRWISIHLMAMRYFVTYKEVDLNKLSNLVINPKLLNSPFTKSEAEYKDPLTIKRNLILILSHWIDVLGKAKDWGAIERELAYTLVKNNKFENQNAALKHARSILENIPEYLDFRTVSREVIQQIHDTDFLDKLKEAIEP